MFQPELKSQPEKSYTKIKNFIERLMENLFKDPGANSFRNGPDERGRFGNLEQICFRDFDATSIDLEKSYQAIKKDDSYWNEYDELLRNYVGRPSPMYFG